MQTKPVVHRIVDLGCGPGNSTAVIAAQYPNAAVVGVDNSAEMLRQATDEHPEWTWTAADIAAWATAEPQTVYDVVFSNAAFHWVPDHPRLFHQLWQHVAPGGVLAVQMPRNFDAPSHQLLKAVAAEGPWAAQMAGAREASFTHPPSYYYDILSPLTERLMIWETEYLHVMPSAESIVDWLRGTGLRPYLARLPSAEDQAAFLREYTARIAEAYPAQANGRRLFPFRRLFILAQKS